ncbi:MAG: cob(I)yrinic acid a,c-diamide adenosyltransferase [Ruminococcaceae bacterium]|nr:cob(I)yrinic acid a,c-diamide adenosyltransferase [Oscillospiraceae bacterium]
MKMIHIYHGDGKGKTTASVGIAIRALGADKKVVFSQFLKSDSSCEIKVLDKLLDVKICKNKHGFFPQLNDKEKAEVIKEQNDLFSILEDTTCLDLLIMDEILDAVYLNIIDEKKLIDFLIKKRETTEIILTGRNPSDDILNLADYITYFKKEKHPFDSGTGARLGIEY